MMAIHRQLVLSLLTLGQEPKIAMASLKIHVEKLDQQIRVYNQLHDITANGGGPFATAKLTGCVFDTGT